MVIEINCPCMTAPVTDRNCLLDKFKEIREQCPAIKEILVPDECWPKFQALARQKRLPGQPIFKLLGYLQMGCLNKITSPVHRYLIENGKPKQKLKNQYRQDLVERWRLEEDALKDHQKARAHEGKPAELMCAEWIEEKLKWKVSNLEALGGDYDIEAADPRGINYAIEVKYLGMEDKRFSEIQNMINTGKGSSGGLDPNCGYNYMLTRIYEAAHQLSRCNKARMVFYIISHDSWSHKMDFIICQELGFFQRPLGFLPCNSNDWKKHLKKLKNEKKKYSNIETDLNATIVSLSQLWIISEELGYQSCQYSLQRIVNF